MMNSSMRTGKRRVATARDVIPGSDPIPRLGGCSVEGLARPARLLSRVTVILAVVCAPAVLLHAERYHYDAPGRLTTVVYDDLSSITYTYDPNGNITAVDVTPAGIPGDANHDGVVDQADVDAIVQITLDGGVPYGATADCNLDDVIDVRDVVCAVGALSPVPAGTPQLALPDLQALRGDTAPASLSISGVSGEAAAVQVDILYDPAVATPGAVTPGAALSDHVVATAMPAAGVLRLVIYSPSNATLGSDVLVQVPFDVNVAAPTGASPLTLAGPLVAGPDASNLAPVVLADGGIQVYAVQADLGVVKSADPGQLSSGDLLTYTIVASNGGPGPVTGAQVSDLVPGNLASVTWSCVPSGGATCTSSGTLDVDDTVDLPVGGTATYTVQGTVDTTPGQFANTATVTAPSDALDSAPGNDASTATVIVDIFADGFEEGDLTGWSVAKP